MTRALTKAVVLSFSLFVASLFEAPAISAQDAAIGKDWSECLGLNAVDELAGTLEAEGLPGPGGSLRIMLIKPGVNFKEEKAKLVACMRTSRGYQPLAVRDVKRNELDGSTDNAEAIVIVPRSLTPRFYDDGSVMVAMGTTYVARAEFGLVGILPAAIVAILVVLVGHILIRVAILKKGHWLDWFTGAGQKPSLSLFQIYIWTWLVIAGSAYVAMLTGDLLPVTPQVLALLGIAGVGSIAARLVAVTQDRPPETTTTPAFTDIFKTDGIFDLYKLQMFLFTAGVAAYVAARIVYDQAFPELDENLLLLLGISNGIYVGSKVASGPSPFQHAEQLDIQVRLLQEARDNADTRVKGYEAKIDAANKLIAAADAATKPQREAELKLLQAQMKDAQAKLAEAQTNFDSKAKERTAAIEKLK